MNHVLSRVGSRSPRRLRIDVVRHHDSDLLIATSDDLRGLMVPARTDDELLSRLPAAIQELLEAQGHVVVRVDVDHEAPSGEGFVRRDYVAITELSDAEPAA